MITIVKIKKYKDNINSNDSNNNNNDKFMIIFLNQKNLRS